MKKEKLKKTTTKLKTNIKKHKNKILLLSGFGLTLATTLTPTMMELNDQKNKNKELQDFKKVSTQKIKDQEKELETEETKNKELEDTNKDQAKEIKSKNEVIDTITKDNDNLQDKNMQNNIKMVLKGDALERSQKELKEVDERERSQIVETGKLKGKIGELEYKLKEMTKSSNHWKTQAIERLRDLRKESDDQWNDLYKNFQNLRKENASLSNEIKKLQTELKDTISYRELWKTRSHKNRQASADLIELINAEIAKIPKRRTSGDTNKIRTQIRAKNILLKSLFKKLQAKSKELKVKLGL